MKVRSILGHLGKFLQMPKKQIRILMYHQVNPINSLEDEQITVTPKQFSEQMNWLHENNWKVITLDDAIQQLKEKKIKDSNQVVLTFDDGFQDNYTYAFPILNKFKFTATIFLISSFIGKKGFLSKSQILEMSQNNIHFGAHTVNHPKLTEINYSDAWLEIESSKNQIELILKKSITSFAYPKGFFYSFHYKMVNFAGFQSALSIIPGGNDTTDNLFSLKRTEIAPHDTLSDFANKLYGGFDWMHLAVQYKQGSENYAEVLNSNNISRLTNGCCFLVK